MKIIKILLIPLTPLYGLITWLRNMFYDSGMLKSESFPLPVIAVGNLSTGGTGKSPHVEYLIRMLRDKYRIATLSRGYGRKTRGFLIAKPGSTPRHIGDEPLMFYRKNAQIACVAVDEKRAHGIQNLIETVNPQVILMDDAFQHRAVRASAYIILTPFDEPFFNDYLLPLGNLREGRGNVRRSDAVVVSKCPQDMTQEQKEYFRQKIGRYTDKPVLFSRIAYSRQVFSKEENMPLQELKDKEILLITGIARPCHLLDFLQANGIRYRHLRFADHHDFNDYDISWMEREFEFLGDKNGLILTTEKDYVRLEHLRLKEHKLFYLPIEVAFDQADTESLQQIINHTIERYDATIQTND